MNIMLFAAGGDIGGGKTHILSLARELSADNQVCLLSFHKGVLADEGRSMGLHVIDMDNGWNVLKDLKMALQAVDEIQPEIIHCHGAKANMMGVLVKKLRSIPVMTTVHSDPKLDYLGMPWKQYTFGLINAVALRQMDFYMAVADRMELNLIERGFDPHKIFTIFNGLDFSGAKENGKEGKENGEIIVGIAARLTPVKDIGTLIRAFAQAYQKNHRLRLRIAGTGEDEQELRHLAEELGVKEQVEFVGWISDIQGFFSEVDINVLSSLSETFPYSLLEGAYEHCPAIASRVGGIPSLITHGENGFLFEAGDVDTFAEYIYRLSVDSGLRKMLAENLFHRAKNEFSLENMKKKQEWAYQMIMKRRQNPKERQGAVICGAYGRGNAGDEAILKAILSSLREIDADMPFWVMTRNRKETRETDRVRAMYMFNVISFFRSLKKAKIFVNGGGSLIQDITSSRSLYFYLFTLWAAKKQGCRVLMYGCGIGPLKSERNRRLAAKVLNQTTEVITLRDSKSMRLLEEIGVTEPEIILTADPVVNIQKSNSAQIEQAFASEGIKDARNLIGFCLRNWPTFDCHEAIAKAAEYASRTYGVIPVFLPIEVPADVSAAQSVASYLQVPHYICTKQHEVGDLIGMLGSMRAVVGMRLHSLIFATAGGAPVIGISYDVKVDSFLKDMNSAACLPLADLTVEALCRQIDRALSDSEKTLSKTAAELLKARERTNRQVAERFLKHGMRNA